MGYKKKYICMLCALHNILLKIHLVVSGLTTSQHDLGRVFRKDSKTAAGPHPSLSITSPLPLLERDITYGNHLSEYLFLHNKSRSTVLVASKAGSDPAAKWYKHLTLHL
uniref:Uncharacterized protein n=1 Tax=Pararge aegeria TaxID=116150 RepID=S4PJT2_9NEOP